MKIGYLGPKGTFSYEACREYCKDKQEMIEYKTIPETILALENMEIEEAIVPIENSLQGCVTDALDTLIQNEDIKVKDELILEIKQNLMANSNLSLKEIEEVYSHPQALAQCKNYLETNLPKAKIISVESTAFAAKKVSESSKNIACIGNIACLEEYNLKLIQKNIQDNNFNKTKFWILSKSENKKTTKNKMSMLFSVKDKPGALYKVLEIFNKYNLDKNKFTILFFGGGEFGLGKTRTVQIFNNFVEETKNNNIQIIAISGKNPKMKSAFEEVVNSNNAEVNVKIIEFSNEVPKLMAISDLVVTKPGGLTTSESLASHLPMIVINPIPGQEEENAEFLESKNIAVWIKKSDNSKEIIKNLLNNKEKIRIMKENTKILARPNSTRDICDILFKN